MSIKLPCLTCDDQNNTNGLFTCNGCGKHFCTNHLTHHTNELRTRFEEVTHEYNSVKEIFDECRRKFSDQHWKLIDELTKALHTIKQQIDQYQKTSNYSENELDQWTQQLHSLKDQISTMKPSMSFRVRINRLLSSKVFRIYIATIVVVLAMYYANSLHKTNSIRSNVSFTNANQMIHLSQFRKTAEHIGEDFTLGSVFLNQIYANDIHHIRFSFEQLSSSSKTFVGLANQQSMSYGWFFTGNEIVYEIPNELLIFRIWRRSWSILRRYFHRDIQPNDMLDLEIDCSNSVLTIHNLRTDKRYSLKIDLFQSPFPWQIVLHLDRRGDRVHLF